MKEDALNKLRAELERHKKLSSTLEKKMKGRAPQVTDWIELLESRLEVHSTMYEFLYEKIEDLEERLEAMRRHFN